MSNSDLRTRLREVAVDYVRAGWPILPVSYPTGDRLICERCPPDVGTARKWWSEELYGIGCRTGELFDALEVPTRLGERVLNLSEKSGPPAVIEVPLAGTWLLLVTPGSPRISDLPAGSGIRLHGRGGWILLPPTPVIGGSATWVRPAELDQLPHSLTVQWLALRVLTTLRREALKRRPVIAVSTSPRRARARTA